MKYLHLDLNFQPYGESIDYQLFTFNGGEPHIKITSSLFGVEKIMITHRIRSFNDLGAILLAADALTRMGINHLELFIPYMPAARQDRVMIPGEPLSVKVYANLINAVGFKKVRIFDAHSEVTGALIDAYDGINNFYFVNKCIQNTKDYVLISPDGGALKKVYKLSSFLGGIPVVECSKQRDVATGVLKGFKVYADDLEGKTCFLIDDICDGGGTFIGLAKALKEKNAGDLNLIVSHGIFSKGFEELKQNYKHIYTTNAFQDIDEEGIEVIKLEELV